jgi:hypothetical protein
LIGLVGVDRPVHDFYNGDAFEQDFLPPANVPNILEVAKALHQIPAPLLGAMEGKTFYLSHRKGRGYTVLGSWPESNILPNVNRGAFIEQPLTKRQTIREFAHILDYHGIQGVYDDLKNHWANLKELRDEIFEVPFTYDPKLRAPPDGYIDVYSTANSAENFAQHFTAYVLEAAEFRTRAKDDALLRKKYAFFREHLFEGREY